MITVIIKYKDTNLIKKVELFNKKENAIAYLKTYAEIFAPVATKVKAYTDTYYEDNILTMQVFEDVEQPKD